MEFDNRFRKKKSNLFLLFKLVDDYVKCILSFVIFHSVDRYQLHCSTSKVEIVYKKTLDFQIIYNNQTYPYTLIIIQLFRANFFWYCFLSMYRKKYVLVKCPFEEHFKFKTALTFCEVFTFSLEFTPLVTGVKYK